MIENKILRVLAPDACAASSNTLSNPLRAAMKKIKSSGTNDKPWARIMPNIEKISMGPLCKKGSTVRINELIIPVRSPKSRIHPIVVITGGTRIGIIIPTTTMFLKRRSVRSTNHAKIIEIMVASNVEAPAKIAVSSKVLCKAPSA